MQSRLTFLETQVARRMLGLFLLCAVLPIVLLVVVSYRHVSRQLNQQSRDRLREASQVSGMALIERLQLIDAELRMASTTLQSLAEVEAAVPEELIAGESRVKALALVRGSSTPYALSGRMDATIPPISAEQEDHLRMGGALLLVTGRSTTPAVLVARLMDPDRPKQGVLWAQIDPEKLWGPLRNNRTLVELCILTDGGTRVLACPAENTEGMPAQLDSAQGSGEAEWIQEGQKYSAGYWTVAMGPHWMASPWTVVLSEPRARVLAPMTAFTRNFLLVTVVSLVLIFLFSNDRIRRGMEPLLRLQEGTLRVARGEFSTPVIVESGDEFERLAHSFNTMAAQLRRQFNALTLINDIGRSALAQPKSESMVEAVLVRLGQDIQATTIAVILRSPALAEGWHATSIKDGQISNGDLRLSPGELSVLNRGGDYLMVDQAPQGYAVLDMIPALDRHSQVLLLPLRDEGAMIGLLIIAYPRGAVVSSEETVHARQLADQITLALANNHLMGRLEQLSWGTLSALARTIDANSPWTAGHSERVTQLSLLIGKELGLSAREQDMLHRGGLLHDIGKIGIPPRLLEKPARLTPEEILIVQSHPVVGSRILAPISVFQDIIPIVLHHHERFDGTGYPDRLAADAIPLLARVIAVADVYDALVSKRPYRPGWTSRAAVAYITRSAGSHHDPAIVKAFTNLVQRGEVNYPLARVSGEEPVAENLLRLVQ
ncbi:MAG: HD domain-containing phosphohydrolase [Gemmatimonadota bacterium]